jgi:hypothetical protein
MADHNPNSTKTTTPPAVHVHHAELPEEHPERHEHSDVSVRGIWITVGAVFIVTILVHVLLYVVFFAYEGAQAKLDESERRSVFPDQRAEPPAGVPRLQGIDGYNAPTSAEDLVKMRAENKAIVNGYGKTADGRAYIPIDRALDIAAEKSNDLLPARAPATKPAATGGAHAAD